MQNENSNKLTMEGLKRACEEFDKQVSPEMEEVLKCDTVRCGEAVYREIHAMCTPPPTLGLFGRPFLSLTVVMEKDWDPFKAELGYFDKPDGDGQVYWKCVNKFDMEAR